MYYLEDEQLLMGGVLTQYVNQILVSTTEQLHLWFGVRKYLHGGTFFSF